MGVDGTLEGDGWDDILASVVKEDKRFCLIEEQQREEDGIFVIVVKHMK